MTASEGHGPEVEQGHQAAVGAAMVRRVYFRPAVAAAVIAVCVSGCTLSPHPGPSGQSYALLSPSPPPPNRIDGAGAAALRAYWDEAAARQLLDELALRYRVSRATMTTEPTDTAANIERLHGTALAVMELEESAAAASGRFDRLADLCLTRLQTEEISPGVVVDVESEDNDSLGRGDIRLFKWLCRAAILPAVVAQGGRQDAATPADEATAAAIERLLNFSDRCAGMPSKSCAEAKPLIAQITAQEPVDPIPRQLKKMVVARTAMPAPSR